MRFYRGSPEFLTTPRRRAHHILIVLPVALFLYLFAAGDNGVYHIWQRHRQIAAVRLEIESKAEENARLQEEVELLEKDLRTIERIARERYGMVRPNESVYMVYPSRPPNTAEDGP